MKKKQIENYVNLFYAEVLHQLGRERSLQILVMQRIVEHNDKICRDEHEISKTHENIAL